MKERVYKTQISDIRVEATLFEPAFFLNHTNSANGIMAEIKQLHKHSSHEIFFILDGSITLCSEQEKTEHSDCIIMIPPHFDHYTVSSVSNGYCMYFRIEQDIKKQKGLFSVTSETLSNKINIIDIDDDIKFYILHLAKNIANDTSEEDNTHIISLIFSSIFKRFKFSDEAPHSNTSKHTKYVFTIDNYIHKNYTKRIRLEELAAELFLCPKQVSRIIRKEYGCSLSDLVNRHKLSVACMLIKNTNLDISDIASMVGYEYENYFFTLFKQKYGVSPLKYRENPGDN